MTSHDKQHRYRPIERVGIVFYIKNRLAMGLTQTTAAWFEHRGATVLLEEECGRMLDGDRPSLPMPELVRNIDVLIAIGGDGTLLHAARHAALTNTPLLGINRGHLGYLTEVSPNQMEASLEKLLRGEYTIEPRMMMDVRVLSEEKVVARYIGLNDAVVKRVITRILRYDLHLNGRYLDTFPADGVIIATPTGSTAYSLAAGGPIVKPDLDVLIICPICAHRFYGRSMVVSASDTVEVTFQQHAESSDGVPDTEGITLTVDGQQSRTLDPAERVQVHRSRHYTHLVRLSDTDFFSVLRSKLA